MKLLQNPWITGSLVVVAVVLVAYQFMPAGGLHFSRSPQPSEIAAPKTSSKPGTTVARQQDRNVSAPADATSGSDGPLQKHIDRQYVESHFPSWVNSPLRDPFLLLDTAKDRRLPTGETNSPVATWKLNGIWHQTGSQLAIINNHIYAEGDEVATGYTLEKIEGNEVWFQGPNRKERLGFRELGRIAEANPTNQPSNSAEQQRPRKGL